MRSRGAKRGFLAEQFAPLPGVYIIRARERVLYVGQSWNTRRRWGGHHWRKFIEVNFPDATVEVIPCEDKDKRLKKEYQQIKKLRPMLNNNDERNTVEFFGLDPNWRDHIKDSPEYKKWAMARRKLFEYAGVKFPY